MSRNLCAISCVRCNEAVTITGCAYALPADHFAQPGMLVADAECAGCATRYTAWIGRTCEGYGAGTWERTLVRDIGFYDLSYRSTFNDEPGPGDIPTGVDIMAITRMIARSADQGQIRLA